jgi:hypothetical protein
VTGIQAVATGVAALVCAQALALTVGALADREDAVRDSWADGLAWCRDRRVQAAAWRRAAAALSRRVLLAVLRAAFPARGRHRTGVA